MERLVVVNGRSRHAWDGLIELQSPYLTGEISRVRWRYPFVLHKHLRGWDLFAWRFRGEHCFQDIA